MNGAPNREKRLAAGLLSVGLFGLFVMVWLLLKDGGRWPAVAWCGLSVAAIALLFFAVVRRYERRLADVSRQLYACLEHAFDAVYVAKGDRIVFANRGAMTLFGVSHPEDIVGHDSMDFIVPRAQEETKNHLLNLNCGGHAIQQPEVLHVRPDGSPLKCEEAWVPLRLGSECGRAVFMREITAKASVAVPEPPVLAGQAEELITGGLAHDINNMLHVINGASELASESDDIDATTRELLESILSAGKGAASLIEQVNMGGRRGPKKEMLEITNLVTGALRRLETSIDPKIQITCLFEREALYVHGDPDALSRAFCILCSKACQAMQEEGVLTISTEKIWLDESTRQEHDFLRPGYYAVLGVADTGSEPRLDVLDNPPTQVSGDRARREGENPGFASVSGIVNSHEGFVRMDRSCGTGVAIRVFLPLASEKGSELDLSGTHFGGDETILVAEDDEAVLSLTSRILRMAGYQVLEAKNGLEAITALHAAGGKVDCLVFDLIMPQMGGLEAYDKIREENPSIPVIFVSAFSEQALNIHLGLVDGVNFVRKPFERQLLLKVIRRCLDRCVA